MKSNLPDSLRSEYVVCTNNRLKSEPWYFLQWSLVLCGVTEHVGQSICFLVKTKTAGKSHDVTYERSARNTSD